MLDMLSGNSTIKEVSKNTGIPYATLYKRYTCGNITADEVIRCARAYGKSPMGELRRFGFIDDGDNEPGTMGLREYSTRELSDEMVRRAENGHMGTIHAFQEASDPVTIDELSYGDRVEYRYLDDGMCGMGKVTTVKIDGDPTWCEIVLESLPNGITKAIRPFSTPNDRLAARVFAVNGRAVELRQSCS
jgi:hypothetical protein